MYYVLFAYLGYVFQLLGGCNIPYFDNRGIFVEK